MRDGSTGVYDGPQLGEGVAAGVDLGQGGAATRERGRGANDNVVKGMLGLDCSACATGGKRWIIRLAVKVTGLQNRFFLLCRSSSCFHSFLVSVSFTKIGLHHVIAFNLKASRTPTPIQETDGNWVRFLLRDPSPFPSPFSSPQRNCPFSLFFLLFRLPGV